MNGPSQPHRPSGARANSAGILAGVGNLTRRELAGLLRTGRWRVQAALWTVIAGGLAALMLWVFPNLLPEAGTGTPGVDEAARNLTDLMAVVASVGVVLITQGTLLDERRNGVLDWLLSKPLTRPALVVAKFTGQGIGLLLTVIVVPWVVVWGLLTLAGETPYNPARTMAAAALLGLLVLFHLGLVLFMSALTASRIVIMAVPIAAIVASDGIVALLPDLFHVLPWSLGGVASLIISDGVVITVWPIVSTAALTLAVVAAASFALNRAEL